MLFKYKGIDRSGKKQNSKIEANSLSEAKGKLRAKGIIYTSITQSNSSANTKWSFKRTHTPSVLILANMSRDIAIYLESGISLVRTIGLLASQYKDDKRLSAFFESLGTFTNEGKSFYQALELQTTLKLPEFYLQSIKISESGGMLQEVLLELSVYLKEQDKINKQISSALSYPVFILIVSVLMVGFMLSFIVPKITAIFDQFDQALPPMTVIVIGAGDFVSNNYHILLVSVIGFASIWAYIMKKSYNFRYKIHYIFLKIPFISSLVEFGELARFAYMNAILIKSGIPMVQAIKLGANIIHNEVIKSLFGDASIKVVEGESLSDVLRASSIYKVDATFIQAIAIGEETSQISPILNNLSKLYSEANKDKITIMLSLLEPFMMLIVGGLIGFIVLAMLLPIFSMNFG